MTSIIQKALAVTKHVVGRGFAVSMLALTVAATVFTVYGMTNEVQIVEGEDVQTVYTTQQDHEVILETYGYEIGDHDVVEYSGVYSQQSEIRITRAFPVEVQCDGDTVDIMVTGGTVRDVLEQAGVTLNKRDKVNQPMDMRVREGDVIKVRRTERITGQTSEALPYKVEYVPTSLLEPGRQKVLVEGQEGLMVRTYEQLVVDGQKQKKELIAEETVQQPVNSRVLVGEAASAVSQLDFGIQMDQSGDPVGYRQVYRGQRAAGYSARPGAKTASGREAVVGHVAVDPNLIPYGTKLYIKSSDGDFIYGCAVAADTGTAIRDGVIAVDLFYGSYMESALNGIKYVDIFVLE